MKFRPCIDIHNGQVKQIVGSSLKDEGDRASENFVSSQDAAFYAKLYKAYGVRGGHIILLNSVDSVFYPETYAQAMGALDAYPGGLMAGGGIHPGNAMDFLNAGASHVIVTSYVFKEGRVDWGRLEQMADTVGKKRLVLDLSCRKKDEEYYIVTDRWQNFTDVRIDPEVLDKLHTYCDEFLIHAVDVEGKTSGIDGDLVKILTRLDNFPVTYAGGIGGFEDLEKLRRESENKLDVTIGSALSLFGGSMDFNEVLKFCGQL